MEYKNLGKSDLQISRIGFGAMSLSMGEQANIQIIDEALNKGINFFDTADLYDKGLNEAVIGKALKNGRDKVIIATKVGNQWRADGSGWDWNPRKEYILECIEKSLRRLDTEYIDLYQLHGGTIDDPIDDVIATFELLKAQGKIRYYGISSIRPNVIREYVNRSAIVSVMSQYSLLDRRPEETILPLLMKNKIGVLARGTVAQGLLISKPAKDYLNQQKDSVEQAVKVVKKLSVTRTAAQTALQFVLQHPAITSAVVGMRTMEQLNEAIEALNVSPLTKEEYSILQQAISSNYYEQHK
jgi:aryl-alcohol dehydrogenase-like predicted oxidoreductase